MFGQKKQAVILVLDDEESVGAFVRAALPDRSYRTIWRPTVESALQFTTEELPDLAIVDIDLRRDLTGWELLKKLRSQPATENMPIVMLTGSADTLKREKSLRMGADRYLVKPVKAETLRRVVNEMLASHDAMWWTLTLKSEQVTRLREVFFDTVTEVPTLALVADEIRAQIEAGATLQVFCLEVEPLFRTGERDLWDSFDHLRREFVRGLRVMAAPILGNDVVIATSHSGGNDFYLFTKNTNAAVVGQTARELERIARNALHSIHVEPSIADEVMIVAGGAITQPQPLFPPRMLYNAVREAKDSAERRETRYLNSMREKLVRAVRTKAVGTVFQPILDLRSGRIVGYEALSRGPAGTELESPEVIFELARDFDLVWEIESLCIANVKPWLEEICSRGQLFFNLESQFISQLQQRGTEIFDAFFSFHHNIVIEVTERSAIRDYRTFRRTLHDLKAMGFRIAIDDCGSGYATLEAIAELKPDYLKVGHSLFTGVEHDPIRRRLVDLVARAADLIGAQTVAEAIETPEQLRVTQELGIQLGQGYLFAAPASWEKIRDWSPSSRHMLA